MKHASFVRRLGAMFYDTLILLALSFLIGFINLAIYMQIYGVDVLHKMLDDDFLLSANWLRIALLMTYFLFFTWFWIHKSQTIGMKAFGLYILNDEGGNISFKQASIRFFIAIPSIFFGFIGMFVMFIRTDKQSWQDVASQSKIFYISNKKSYK